MSDVACTEFYKPPLRRKITPRAAQTRFSPITINAARSHQNEAVFGIMVVEKERLRLRSHQHFPLLNGAFEDRRVDIRRPPTPHFPVCLEVRMTPTDGVFHLRQAKPVTKIP